MVVNTRRLQPYSSLMLELSLSNSACRSPAISDASLCLRAKDMTAISLAAITTISLLV